MLTIRATLVTVIMFLVNGCITFTPEKVGKIYQRDGVSTLLMPSSSREVYFKDSNATEKHCRAPGPDISIQSSEGFSIGSALISKSESIGEKSSQSALALGGRDPAVLITRELLYRACELSSNLNADKQMTINIYKMFLKTVDSAIKMQQTIGTASASAIASANINAPSLPMQQNQTGSSSNSMQTENETPMPDSDPLNNSNSNPF